MRFDTIIIGGGLAGLVCGIKLQKAGQKCAIISAGQSAMHFSSGAFDLLGRLPDGTEVKEPLKAISSLPAEHPYSIIGAEKVAEYAAQAKGFFADCGVKVTGDASRNSWRITPTGERKPSWLTIGDFTPLAAKEEKIGNKALIVNILGYLDFNTKFLADSFEKQGTECRIVALKLEEMERLRKNPSEMRSTNIARVMDREGIWETAVSQIRTLLKDEDVIVLPAVFGLKDGSVVEKISETLGKKTIFVATMPPSVPGIRTQMTLKAEFEKAGGRFFLGDTVIESKADENGIIKSISTVNFNDIRMEADNFVLATGSFFSKGLIATPEKVCEPVFGIDLTYREGRENWFNTNFWEKQNYISFGAKVDETLNASIAGKKIVNLYAIGSVIGGTNSLYEGCGGGTAIVTALAAADRILEKK
ncbi:MAG: anaerobic glycerol-3-phosphate dehydrogenase subunit B [Bacteroidales bacterium]|nr:anaerobic glycerol-3-phosphate dehydrogenase subunit B [Bacteroidales bacterium]